MQVNILSAKCFFSVRLELQETSNLVTATKNILYLFNITHIFIYKFIICIHFTTAPKPLIAKTESIDSSSNIVRLTITRLRTNCSTIQQCPIQTNSLL